MRPEAMQPINLFGAFLKTFLNPVCIILDDLLFYWRSPMIWASPQNNRLLQETELNQQSRGSIFLLPKFSVTFRRFFCFLRPPAGPYHLKFFFHQQENQKKIEFSTAEVVGWVERSNLVWWKTEIRKNPTWEDVGWQFHNDFVAVGAIEWKK